MVVNCFSKRCASLLGLASTDHASSCRDTSTDDALFRLTKRTIMRTENDQLDTWRSHSCATILGDTAILELQGIELKIGLHVLLIVGMAIRTERYVRSSVKTFEE